MKSNLFSTRKSVKILMVLYDGEKKSAYRIGKNPKVSFSESGVKHHLGKFEKAGLVSTRDKNKRSNPLYQITDQGRSELKKVLRKDLKDLKDMSELADEILGEKKSLKRMKTREYPGVSQDGGGRHTLV